MKKEYQKPEVEIINLQAEERITGIPLGVGVSYENQENKNEDMNGETSTVERPSGWL